MDALVALIAELLAGLRALVAPELCPGGWAWATTLLGIGVGLVPAAGAIGAAWLRKPGRSMLAVASGVLSAGLLPLLIIVTTGQVFAGAAAGGPVPGLDRRDLRDLGGAECFVGPQDSYLGETTVGGVFDTSRPVLLGVAVLAFGLLPLVTALFVAAQARLALRHAPKWPVKVFWLSVLALPVLTAAAPAGASAHLWLGASVGALVGIPAVLVARPSSAAARRLSGARPTPSNGTARAPGARALPSGAAARPVPGVNPASSGNARPASAPPALPAQRRLDPHPPVQPAAGPAGWRARWAPLAGRLANRFATRVPVPPIVLPPERTPLSAPPDPRPQSRPHRPTLAIPEPRGTRPAVRFRLVRRLGAGGFGRVWLADDAQLGHPVALKAAHAPDDDTEQRIRREAKALATVRHEQCVGIYDLVHARSDPGLADLDGLVIVMEYLAGPSLVELVRDRGVLADVAAARIWAGVAAALDAAHSRGVLHRDVKPANIVIDAAGLAHLIDFGIARSTGDSTLTLAGWILGTPDFLAPEIVGGAPATPASDAWQLAATISYAMTGHPPRGEHTDIQSGLRAAASGAQPTHLPQRTAHLPLLRAALDTDPARRPPLAEVHAALEGWLRRATSPSTGSTLSR